MEEDLKSIIEKRVAVAMEAIKGVCTVGNFIKFTTEGRQIYVVTRVDTAINPGSIYVYYEVGVPSNPRYARNIDRSYYSAKNVPIVFLKEEHPE